MAAQAVTKILEGFDATDQTAFSTASWQSDGEELYLLAVMSHTTAGPNGTPVITGHGTWTEIDLVSRDAGQDAKMHVFGFRPTGGGQSVGATTITWPSTSLNTSWCILKVTNVPLTVAGCVVQTLDGQGGTAITSLTITLSAVAKANNQIFGFFGHTVVEGITVGSGFTEVADQGAAGAFGVFAEHKQNDVTVDASWATVTSAVGIAMEIRQMTHGSVTWPISMGIVTAARVIARSAVTWPISMGFVTAARLKARSSVTWPISMGIVTAGRLLARSSVTWPITATIVTVGRIKARSSVTWPITMSFSVGGVRRVLGSVTWAIDMAFSTTGRIKARSSVTWPISIIFDVAGRAFNLFLRATSPDTETLTSSGPANETLTSASPDSQTLAATGPDTQTATGLSPDSLTLGSTDPDS